MTPQDHIDKAADTIAAHDRAYEMAQGCPVYAPKHGTDEGEALRNATRSGRTSASCGNEWMRLFADMKQMGLVSLKHPHLFHGIGK